jgi:hypothetical protein
VRFDRSAIIPGVNTERATVVAEPAWVPPALLVAFPLGGAGAAWGVQAAASWIASLPWFPRQRLFELLAEQPELRRALIAAGVGLVLGLVIGLKAVDELVVITIGSEEATLVEGRKRLHVPRGVVAAVFRDGKYLVVRDQAGEERWRAKVTLDAAAVREAFVQHGYPWRDSPR